MYLLACTKLVFALLTAGFHLEQGKYSHILQDFIKISFSCPSPPSHLTPHSNWIGTVYKRK